MDNNIVETVYNSLDARTDEIRKAIVERDKLDEKIKSGRYSQKALEKELRPQLNDMRQTVSSLCDQALKEAHALIDQYRADVAELDNLNPADLTDDVKLLQPGITLLPRDIQGMLKRNATNRTMVQIIMRYANEHNIDTGSVYYIAGQEERQTAQNLETILFYYKNWIDKPEAKKMLDKFFQR